MTALGSPRAELFVTLILDDAAEEGVVEAELQLLSQHPAENSISSSSEIVILDTLMSSSFFSFSFELSFSLLHFATQY